jgi:hypothetical protein
MLQAKIEIFNIFLPIPTPSAFFSISISGECRQNPNEMEDDKMRWKIFDGIFFEEFSILWN